MNFSQRIKDANRMFYDQAAPSYEQIDGRRSLALVGYIRQQIAHARNRSHTSLLDLGCGSGFVTKALGDLFTDRYAVDLSPRIIKAIKDPAVLGIAADCEALPFKDATFDVVTAFATLHHLPSVTPTIREAWRVLRPGGFYYSDHDMDDKFFDNFSVLLKLYRMFTNPAARFSRHCGTSSELYHTAEAHEDGIDSAVLAQELKSCSFSEVIIQRHWFGLSSLTDALFGQRVFRAGLAPLVRVIAIK